MLEELKQIFEKYEGKINSIVQFIKMWRIAMTIYIALLRGINVGGHKIIKMADLKQTFESIGLKQVKTYIQSGNIVFESERDIDFLNKRIQSEIKNVFGFDVPVMLRTHEEFINVIKRCPYEVNSLREGESIHVAFLANELSELEKRSATYAKNETEDCYIHEKSCVFIFQK